jgi:hypothetical protein
MKRLAAFLILLAATNGVGRAQAPPAVAPGTARLLLHCDRCGGVDFTLTLPAAPTNFDDLKEALSRVLSGPPGKLEPQAFPWGGFVVRGRVKGALGARPLGAASDVEVAPLLEVLRPLRVKFLVVDLYHPALGFSESNFLTTAETGVPGLPWLKSVVHQAILPTNEPPPRLHVAFGYRTADLPRLIPLGVVLLVPLLVTLYVRHRALRAHDADPLAVWFGYWCFQQKLVPALWCLWLTVVFLPDTGQLAYMAVSGLRLGSTMTTGALTFVVPPLVCTALCQLLGVSVFVCAPAVGWTSGMVRRQALWQLVGRLLVLVLGAVALDLWDNGRTALAGGVGSLGVVAGVVCLGFALQARDVTPNPLPPGEVRDRLFHLAEEGEVRLAQAHVVSPPRWRLLNVFAVVGLTAHLTPAVVRDLRRREVDAVLALELAYLWCRRHSWRPVVYPLVGVALGVGALGAAYLFAGLRLELYWSLAVVPMLFAGRLFVRPLRRFSPDLDREAVTRTGDPEALLTALAKLHERGLLPLSCPWWGCAEQERALQRRLEAAAERFNIPPERLQEILDGPGTGDETYPPLVSEPGATPAAANTLFSRVAKTGFSIRMTWLLIPALVCTPAGAALLAQRLRPTSALVLLVVLAAGLAATILLRRLGLRLLVGRFYRKVRRQLLARLEPESVTPDSWQAVFVGLAPDAAPRVYDGFYDWDLGFLLPRGDSLCYIGDQTRFVLRRDQVSAVYLGAGPPVWRAGPRVYVRWHDKERGTAGTLQLHPADRTGAGRRVTPATELERRLRMWWECVPSSASVPLPEPLADLTTPSHQAIVGVHPARQISGPVFVFYLVFLELLAVGTASLTGLSFDPEQGGAAWYVLLVVGLTLLVEVVPSWCYRDRNEAFSAREVGKPEDDDGSD